MRDSGKKAISYALGFAGKYALLIVFAFLASLAYSAATICIPLITGEALDSMLRLYDPSSIRFYVMLLGLLTAAAVLSDWVLSYLASDIAYKIARDMRKQGAEAISEAKLSYIDAKPHGAIVSTVISDIDIISDGLIQIFLQLFTGLFIIIGTLIIMFFLCWPLALTVMLLTPLPMLASVLISRGTARTFKKQSDLRAALNGLTVENFENHAIVISNTYEAASEDRFDAISHKLERLDFWTGFFSALVNPATRFLNALIYGTVATLGAVFIYDSVLGMTAGGLLSFLLFTNNYTQPFNAISNVMAQLQNSFASARRLAELMALPRLEPDKGKKTPARANGRLEVSHVWFSYDGANPVLKDVSFSIGRGMKVALVGPTGCGKTTLINLIMMFYQPQRGCIRVSGIDETELSRRFVRESFGMVLQDTWLFRGTIRQNIKYGLPEAGDDMMEKAAERAGADFFIRQLPNGYDTYLGSGLSLSEGQRQLISLSRLMLRKPEALILDEATSNLDARSELAAQKAFDQMMKGRTSLVIAHRLSTIVSADLILVMRDGRIIERGRHEDLLKADGFYASLFRAQFVRI